MEASSSLRRPAETVAFGLASTILDFLAEYGVLVMIERFLASVGPLFLPPPSDVRMRSVVLVVAAIIGLKVALRRRSDPHSGRSRLVLYAASITAAGAVIAAT
ncbi:MAG: hypothetical protein H0V49_02485 [Nocardioidaceae bacterium]|nr:hypothetical protein [Nocardioidaceae bacterium]